MVNAGLWLLCRRDELGGEAAAGQQGGAEEAGLGGGLGRFGVGEGELGLGGRCEVGFGAGGAGDLGEGVDPQAVGAALRRGGFGGAGLQVVGGFAQGVGPVQAVLVGDR